MIKTQKRSQSSKIDELSQAKSAISRRQSQNSKIAPSKSINDDSVIDKSINKSVDKSVDKSFDKSAEKPVNISIKDQSEIDVISRNKSITNGKSQDLSQDELSKIDDKILAPSPTEEQLKPAIYESQLQSNDTTIQDLLKNKMSNDGLSEFDVRHNDGDNLSRTMTPVDAKSSKTIANPQIETNNELQMFDQHSLDSRDVLPNFGDQMADTVTIDGRSQFSRIGGDRRISGDILINRDNSHDRNEDLSNTPQKRLQDISELSHRSKHSSFGNDEEHKTNNSVQNNEEADTQRRDYRETSYFGVKKFELDRKNQPSNRALLQENKLSTIGHSPDRGLYEIESEGIQDLIRHTEPEPEFEDQAEPDGENEDGNIQDDSRTIYYNQTMKSFFKSEASAKKEEKEIQYTPNIKEISEKQSESQSEKPSPHGIENLSKSLASKHSIEDEKSQVSKNEPINEPDSKTDNETYLPRTDSRKTKKSVNDKKSVSNDSQNSKQPKNVSLSFIDLCQLLN